MFLHQATLSLGYNHYSKTQFNGNKQLIVNSLNYILGNDKLINIRSKEINLRLLNKSEIKKNRLKWQLFNTIIPIATIIVLITLKISRKENLYEKNYFFDCALYY